MKINDEIKNEYPWAEKKWTDRVKAVADIIRKDQTSFVSVVDLGGGLGELYKYLYDGTIYTSIDLKPWTDQTIVSDFNKDEYPDLGSFIEPKYVVAQGIIEYIKNKRLFFKSIRKYGDTLILTYRIWSTRQREKLKTEHPKIKVKEQISFDELKLILKKNGWKVEKTIRHLAGANAVEKIFVCRKI